MSTRTILISILIACACLALGAAGCSDDDDGRQQQHTPDAGADAADDSGGQPDAYNPCDDDLDYCDEECVDTQTSADHCGSCGATCLSFVGECIEGTCHCDNPDATWCDGYCVDTDIDRDNCGTCGNVCGESEVCYQEDCWSQSGPVLEETNTVRSTPTDCGSEGNFDAAPALRANPYLNQAAQTHADDMAANKFMDHTGSDGSSPAERISRTDYAGSPGGENVARGQQSAEDVVQAWVDSDGHCANIMNAGFTEMGIGYAEDDSGHPYWAQVFGRQ